MKNSPLISQEFFADPTGWYNAIDSPLDGFCPRLCWSSIERIMKSFHPNIRVSLYSKKAQRSKRMELDLETGCVKIGKRFFLLTVNTQKFLTRHQIRDGVYWIKIEELT